jgi:hypothetical protein
VINGLDLTGGKMLKDYPEIRKYVLDSLKRTVILLQKKVHHKDCDGGKYKETPYSSCPLTCSCRRNKMSPLNLITAMVWRAADEINDLIDCIAYTGRRGCRPFNQFGMRKAIADIETVRKRIKMYSEAMLYHNKQYRGPINIFRFTNHILHNLIYYLEEYVQEDFFHYHTRLDQQKIKDYLTRLSMCKNLRRIK